eukprot:14278523-Heterocapsa_arctica.AAC.1
MREVTASAPRRSSRVPSPFRRNNKKSLSLRAAARSLASTSPGGIGFCTPGAVHRLSPSAT